jgi:transcriptional regulator with XRE-family HTH domain
MIPAGAEICIRVYQQRIPLSTQYGHPFPLSANILGRLTMKLHDRLAELRRESGLTLRELRERIEARTGERLSISYLSELERTETTPPMETLSRIAQGYDLTLGDLLEPVDFFAGPTGAGLPKGLRDFVDKYGIDPEWAASLARIEFRGQRPRSESEWQAIYGILRAFLEPKPREKAKG